ncbi:MAG: polyphosphate polymerase domain-containing protein [Anaerolineaceae bacterium]|nr:polyphosphate polymerase domain-containing protein [Anaerolineaceae bacterium]
MSTLSHSIRNFNRFELKYLITLRQAEMLRSSISDYLHPDENGNGNGNYLLTSLYYDSPDYSCYWEKMDGVRFRRKLRLRHYQTQEKINDNTPVFVEIKQRYDRVTQKRRVTLSYQQALLLCNQRQLPDQISLKDIPVIQEISGFIWQYNLQPVSIVRYQRQAFVGSDFDLGLRITFDTQMSSQTRQLDLMHEPDLYPMFSPDQVIMEIKVNERIPYWLTEMVANHNLRLVRVSKYCRSIDIAKDYSPYSKS